MSALPIGTYPRPQHGWTCFHCGETFGSLAKAALHFGADPSAEPACRIKGAEEHGLLVALREVEKHAAELATAVEELMRDAPKDEAWWTAIERRAAKRLAAYRSFKAESPSGVACREGPKA